MPVYSEGNFELKKKKKLKLQIHLLEQQVNANQTFAIALNANFVVANTDSFLMRTSARSPLKEIFWANVVLV